MQIKVESVRMHKHPDSKYGWKANFEVPVADGKLVLVECKPEEALIFKLLNGTDEIGGDRYWLTGGRIVKGPGTYYKPIIISETEKIEQSDWVYSIVNKQIYTYSGEPKADLRKILALSEHFSPEQLQDIVEVDGRLKEGKVLVECTPKLMEPHKDEFGDIRYNKYQNIIKLNSSNHITIYMAGEKMYTEQERNKAIWSAISTMVRSDKFDGSYTSALEWFKQNIK
jgi:hypothetical protein